MAAVTTASVMVAEVSLLPSRECGRGVTLGWSRRVGLDVDA